MPLSHLTYAHPRSLEVQCDMMTQRLPQATPASAPRLFVDAADDDDMTSPRRR
jgi:hypothetical protein